MLRVLGPLLCALWLLPALAQERQERIVESVLPALAYGPKCSSTLQLHNLSDVAEIVQSIAPEFRGKGGGKPDFAQASFPNLDQARAAAERLERTIREKLGIPSG